MGFTAKRFSFDRIPCEQYGLRIFDIDGNDNEAAPFTSTGSLQTDVIPSIGRVFLYGRAYDTPLEFTLVFGIDPCMADESDYLDRYDMDAIANWLTDHNTYKWLEIEQADMEMIRYHCVISDLTPIQISWLPWAFTATVTCDSPYAYMFPKKYVFDCTAGDSTDISIVNLSTLRRLYYPKLRIYKENDETFVSITNTSVQPDSGGVEMAFNDLPSGAMEINIDNELGTVTTDADGVSNPYQYFNFQWLPLAKGRNNLTVSGRCVLTFECSFPVNYGG